MTVLLGSSLASKGICLFVDLCWLVEGAALSRRTQNEIVVSWITLWGMIKNLKYTDLTDLTLAYIFDHAVCCASAASSGRSLHLITSQLRMK